MKTLLLGLCGLAVLTATVRAETYTLEKAVQTALLQNRDLAAARFAVARAEARLRQAGLLPNPTLEFSGLSDVVFGAEGEGAVTLGFAQTFPLTNRLGLEKQLRRYEVAQALREIRDYERRLIARVQSLYVEVQSAREASRILEASRKRADDTAAFVRRQVEGGQGSLPEQSIAAVEARRIGAGLITSQVTAESNLLELKTALGLPAQARIELPDPLDAIVRRLQARKKTSERIVRRPDVEIATLDIDRAATEVRLAQASAWEGITIGIDYTYERSMDEPEGFDNSHLAGLNISLPLPVWNRQQGAIAENQAAAAAARARLKALELELANTIATATRKADLLEGQRRRFDTETQNGLDSMESELQRGYDQGLVNLRDLLTLRTQVADLRASAQSNLADLALALIDLESVTGRHPALARPYLETKKLSDR